MQLLSSRFGKPTASATAAGVSQKIMKAKVFDVVLQNLPPNKSPAAYLEEQLNGFFRQNQTVRLVTTHMNTLILPPKARPGEDKAGDSTVIIFSTLFYE
jgi:hypothetical protein